MNALMTHEVVIDYAQKTVDWLGDASDIQREHGLSDSDLPLYLESAGRLVSLHDNDDSWDVSKDGIRDYLHFTDPLKAYEAAQELGLSNNYTASNIMLGLHFARHNTNDAATEVHMDSITAFKSAHTQLEAYVGLKGLDASVSIRRIATTIREHDDPLAYSSELAAALEAALDVLRPSQKLIFQKLQATAKPSEIINIWSILDKGLANISLPQEIIDDIYTVTDTERTARMAVNNIRNLADRGCDFSDADKATFFTALSTLVKEDSEPTVNQNEVSAEQFCMEYFRKMYGTIAKNRHLRFTMPRLYLFPELKKDMLALGLSKELSEKIFETWTTYDSLRQVRRAGQKPTPSRIDKAGSKLGEWITKQQESMFNYSGAYGNSELIDVIEIFGIHNFASIPPADLHKQYLSWQEGKSPTTNVVITARNDWNKGLQSNFNHSKKNFGKNFVYFEASSSLDLSRIAISIGRRERQNGRQPKVKNLIISPHSSPDGILLGPNRNTLDVDDFDEAESKLGSIGLRPNNYRKHLGRLFRVILDGCCTAGDNGGEANITEALGEFHKTKAVGAKDETHTGVVISPTGRAIFKQDQGWVAGTTYNGRLASEISEAA